MSYFAPLTVNNQWHYKQIIGYSKLSKDNSQKENPMADEPIQHPKGQSTTPDPSGQDGKSTTPEPDKNPEIIDNLPEQFKGKTAAEIAKSYIELQKQYGKHTQDVSKTREELAKWEKLGQVLEDDPELYKQVEEAIDKLSGKKSDTIENDQAPQIKDIKVTQENSIINEFEKDFGINSLSTEKRQALHEKIGTELAEMLDPGGKKTVRQVMDSLPLPKLRTYLEKAYRLATDGDREERARMQAFLENRQNNEASFGSIPSSSVSSKQGQLTEAEKVTAKKMGISEEAYLKQKTTIENE